MGIETIQQFLRFLPFIFVVIWFLGIVFSIARAVKKDRDKGAWKTGWSFPQEPPGTPETVALAPSESVLEHYGTIETSFLGFGPAHCSLFLVQAQAGCELAFVAGTQTSESGPSQFRLGYAGYKRLRDILGTDEKTFAGRAAVPGYVDPRGASIARSLRWFMHSVLRFEMVSDLGFIEDTRANQAVAPGPRRKGTRSAAAMVWRRGDRFYLALVFRSRQGGSPALGIQLFGEAGRNALRGILHRLAGFGSTF